MFAKCLSLSNADARRQAEACRTIKRTQDNTAKRCVNGSRYHSICAVLDRTAALLEGESNHVVALHAAAAAANCAAAGSSGWQSQHWNGRECRVDDLLPDDDLLRPRHHSESRLFPH